MQIHVHLKGGEQLSRGGGGREPYSMVMSVISVEIPYIIL